MREIKYRGIDFDTDKWLYGSLVQPHPGKTEAIWHLVEGVGNQINIIKPGTSGQYTGLKDRNGKEICEGDILGTETDDPLYVEYSVEYGSFLFVDNFDQYGIERYTAKEISYDAFEVIGNIHENPELLEEKQ